MIRPQVVGICPSLCPWSKTPQNLCRPTKIRDAAAKLGVNVKFVVLTRHPFSWTSEKHPFNQGCTWSRWSWRGTSWRIRR